MKELFNKKVDLGDAKTLLIDIRKENCRQIIINRINLRLLERAKTKEPTKLDLIEVEVKKAKKGIEQLIEGLDLIDDELKEYENETRKGN